MDFSTYRHAYFTDPAPDPRFAFEGVLGVALYFAEFESAVDFYTAVLGPPAYAEGRGTRGWRIGRTWLTLLDGGDGAPSGVEIPIVADTPAEAERLQRAFIDAGGTGPHPADRLMYEPIRSCPVTDPFGTRLLVMARLT